MSVIDWLLNLACLLLWLNWRSIRFSRLPGAPGISLAGTIKPTGTAPPQRWSSLAALLGILGLRSVLYSQIGSQVNWIPVLRLGMVALPFRSDRFPRIALYSFLEFGLWLATLYASLLLLSVVNRAVPDTNPWQRLVRLHLGRLERAPGWMKLALGPFWAAMLWVCLHPALASLGIVPAADPGPLSRQAALLALASVLLWKYALVATLGLHIVHSYIYVGRFALWEFATTTAHHLLRPARWLPLRLGKFDLIPVLALAVVIAVAEGLLHWLPFAYRQL